MLYKAIVGDDDYLLYPLNKAISQAKSIKIIVAFLMESGVKLLAPELKNAIERGVNIQILTGKYLSVTEPSAIYYLKDILGDRLDIRFYKDNTRSFHPKAYIFEYDTDAEIFVGSSNISHSALTRGIEWNYRLQKSQNETDYNKFLETFEQLYNHCSIDISADVLKEYASNWKKPAIVRLKQPTTETAEKQSEYSPRGAQIEALYELKKCREEGVTKGLVVAATGVGKTFLAAFDSVNYQRVLFLAHREEILKQAEKTFKAVRPGSKVGYFSGARRDENADIYLATVQTLTRADNLHTFTKDFFQYIVVDEFHHAAADSYLNVINYFEPEFLLGLTATPYRTDNRDIYSICENNVIYEIYLKDAVNRDLLVPFKYFGIYDVTDYDQVAYHSGKYVIEDLERQLSRKERADLVLSNYHKFAKQRTIGFCASISHAEYMAQYFSGHGIPAVAVHSGNGNNKYVMNRAEAIKAIDELDIKVIFAVDIFNEGVDIPSIDTVMLLRPTESFVVFLQQLGRGLRKFTDKLYLTVLDFIGNYKKAHYLPALLAGDNPMNPKATSGKSPIELEYPENCQVNFDFKVLDLFAEMAKSDPLVKRLRNDFYQLYGELDRRPTRLDMYSGSDLPIREYLKDGWLRFLDNLNELTDEEEKWLGTDAELFIKEIEKTSMTKSYKIPTIGALLTGNSINARVPLAAVGENFMSFYKDAPLHQKDFNNKNNKNWQSWDVKKFTDLARKNPVHFLSKGKNRFFNYDEINRMFYLSAELEPYLTPALAKHVQDILEYRRLDYFHKRFKED